MRFRGCFAAVCALLVCGYAAAPSPMQTQSAKATPLILEKDQGEDRVWRPIQGLELLPSPFILKVDPRNGGSSHLVFGSEDLPPGEQIEAHFHPHSDEIVFLRNGAARVSLGAKTQDVQGETTVFIPAGTMVAIVNTGKEAIHLLFVFSAPGFEKFMRAESVRAGEKVAPLTRAEDAAIMAKHKRDVIYKAP